MYVQSDKIKAISKQTHSTYLRVDGRPANQIANSDIIKLAKSVSKWAASVAIAKLFDHIPPTTSKIIKITHKILAIMSFRLACISTPSWRPTSLWQCSGEYTIIIITIIKWIIHGKYRKIIFCSFMKCEFFSSLAYLIHRYMALINQQYIVYYRSLTSQHHGWACMNFAFDVIVTMNLINLKTMYTKP